MSNPNAPTLSLEEAQKVVSTKTAPRVTKESIEARIGDVSYIVHDTLTVCVIRMVNGFNVTGTAAPASAANYDPEVGKRFAYDRAFMQLWQLEGYLLREKLDAEERAAVAAKAPAPVDTTAPAGS